MEIAPKFKRHECKTAKTLRIGFDFCMRYSTTERNMPKLCVFCRLEYKIIFVTINC